MSTKKAYDILLGEYLKYWQDSLKLKHWKITVRFVDESPNYGGISISSTHSEAIIEFLHPDSLGNENWGVKDLEVTVVHELLHLRFYFCMARGKSYHDHKEQAIESCALSMVAARRNVSIKDIK